MRHSIRALLTGLVLAGGASLLGSEGAQAQSYPRVTCSGDNCDVDYGPMARGNIVGGGHVVVTGMTGMNFDFIHLDRQFSQTPREGFVPLTVGSGESVQIIWVPAAMMAMIQSARQSMPAR